MKIKYNYNDDKKILEIFFDLDLPNGDKTSYINHKNKTITLAKQNCKFILPSSFKRTHLHNDLVALSAILIIYPFIGNKIEFLFQVSKPFCSELSKTGKRIEAPVKPYQHLNSRTTIKQALAYSGGYDSTAASILLPNDTVHVFLDRINPISKQILNYRKDQIYFSLDMLMKIKKNVVSIKTDLEYMREPKGFIFDLACGIPCILLSRFYNFKHINYGYVLHHLEQFNLDGLEPEYYCLGQWKLYIKCNQFTKMINKFSFWDNLFEIVDLKISFPLKNMSEIQTYRLVNSNKIYKLKFSSCMRGLVNKPCGKCKKCAKIKFLEFLNKSPKQRLASLNKLLTLIKYILKQYGYSLKTICDYGNFYKYGLRFIKSF